MEALIQQEEVQRGHRLGHGTANLLEVVDADEPGKGRRHNRRLRLIFDKDVDEELVVENMKVETDAGDQNMERKELWRREVQKKKRNYDEVQEDNDASV